MLKLKASARSGIMLIKCRDQSANLMWLRRATQYEASESYQYLQRSKLPTMYFQRSLPRLPIPLLEKTCERFLSAVQPILEASEYEETKQIVDEFQTGEGMDLHARLRLHDSAHKYTSYISQPWFDMYLSDRAPLPLNYNPMLIMKSDTRQQYQDQVVRTANIVISSLRFWRSLQADLLEPEVFHMNSKKSDTESYRKWMGIVPTVFATYASYAFKAFPLDMSQYSRLFGTTRIPKLGRDVIVQSKNSRHILVLRCGNIYAVDVINESGCIESPSVILGRLQAVLKFDVQREPATFPVGVLTTGNRDDWARTREYFITNKKNAYLLQEEVDKALFCVCLDVADDGFYDYNNPIPFIKHFLAGKAINRWFDKSFSWLIAADGTAAVNFEHSWGDGVAILRYFNEVYKDTLQSPFVDTSTVATLPSDGDQNVRVVQFELDDRMRADISAAYEKNSHIVDSMDMHLLIYPHINKDVCKKFRLSPDSVMQLSFQLAYRQAFNKYVGTYESCSTAAFRHGRTETMRPCTMETKNFCEAILKATPPGNNYLRTLIDKCSKVHGQLTKDAAMGQGFDRHLFALRNTALVNDLIVPKFYESVAYKKINHHIISSSTLSSDALLAGAFGPVVKDGLGIVYSIQGEFCGAIATSYKGQASSKDFITSLESAFNKIRNIIINSKSN